MRLIHNFLNLFRRDSGAHFTYNIGVSLMRAALIFFFVTVVLCILSKLFGRVTIEHAGTASVSLTKVDCELFDNDYRRYSVHFVGTRSDGMPIDQTQYTTKEQYQEYLTRDPAAEYTFNVYKRSDNGPLFITSLSRWDAESEFYDTHLDLATPFPNILIWVSAFITLMLFLLGRRQIKLSLKYPRSDIPQEFSKVAPASSADERKLLEDNKTDGADENEVDT